MGNKYDIFSRLEKSKERLEYFGVDLLRPLRTKMYFEGFIGLFKFIIYCLFFTVRISSGRRDENGPLIFLRRDVLEQGPSHKIISDFLTIIERGSITVLDDTFCLRSTVIKFFCAVKYTLTFRDLGRHSLVLGFAAAKSRIDVDIVRSKISNPNSRAVVTFCDAIGHENLVAMFLRNAGSRTYTLQHGQYRNLHKNNISQDIEAFSNFVSDYMFCWGAATINEYADFKNSYFAGISNTGILLETGKFHNFKPHCKEDEHHTGVFSLVFSGENSKLDNYRLLEYARNVCEIKRYKFHIRLHPSNNFKDYLAKVGGDFIGIITEENYFTKVDFSVMCMTGFFLECIEYMHPFYILETPYLPNVFKNQLPLVMSDGTTEINKTIDFDALKILFNNNKNQVEILKKELF
jgi:hypothetical protein